MTFDPAQLPDDIATLKAMIVAANIRTLDLNGQIAHLKLTIAKMQRDTHGASSEKGARLLDQMELQLDELIATVAEGQVATAIDADGQVETEAAQKPTRRALPSHCRVNGSCIKHLVLVRIAAVTVCENSARPRQRRWRSSP